MKRQPLPVVLSIAGHDPTGGAGIQADIEAIAALGCHPVTVVSTITVQNTRNVQRVTALAPELIEQQARILLQDIPVQAIKIGLIGSAANARAISSILEQHPTVPVVLDTVLAAGGGTELASTELLRTIREQLLPRATLATPNSLEARRLTDATGLEECAVQMLESGCKAVLITGTHEVEADVSNRLFRPGQASVDTHWPRLPERYHGSGCTLAAAIAALLAAGQSLEEAVARAQEYTWNSLCHGFQPGAGQYLPDRLITCRKRMSPS